MSQVVWKTKNNVEIIDRGYSEKVVKVPDDCELEVEDYIELLSYSEGDRVRFYSDAVEAFWANECLVEKVKNDWTWEEWLRSLDGKNSEEVVNEAEWFQDQLSNAFGVDFWHEIDDWKSIKPNCEKFGEF